ncbi:apolipoprotein N-acyltransferase [Teredinibacter turnerae]|uniref:apolipoprotein N-acyltransferase n=1 Tax=Teredinibacter turnerae TaxID=2426 RepID=UPI0030CE52E9
MLSAHPIAAARPAPPRRWPADILAFVAGALLTLNFAPFDLWMVGLLGVAIFAHLLPGLPNKRAWWRSFVFGLGMFGGGVSWVYVSIHDFGFTGAFLAALMTAVFVAFLALVFSLPFLAYRRWQTITPVALLLVFPAIWVLGEWSRSWFLTGFPWLYLGYGHIGSPLAGWAPVGGVYAVSFAAVFTATAIGFIGQRAFPFWQAQKFGWRFGAVLTGICTLLWGAGFVLQQVRWTHHNDTDQLTVSLVQPNIPLELKWNPLYRPQIVRTLLDLTEPEWQSDIVLWPEAAIPYLYHDAKGLLDELETRAQDTNTALISGLLFDDIEHDKYFNAILGLGTAHNMYFKQRLVPFGEYMPLEKWLRGLIAFFDLPNSVINRGPANQTGLQVGDYSVAPYICYEVVYPDLVASNLNGAEVIVTISNDAWFGHSIGPLQHYQMAQMRALETGRYVIRGTNTGLSGIIDPRGRTIASGQQFISQSLHGHVYRMHGSTPFTQTGSWPIVLLSLFLLGLASFGKRILFAR